ncbi:MAG: hypothetical protein AB7F89_14295 [Pirellulaceae bacterium]
MDIFIAGIMQGSHHSTALHDQDYRARLKRVLSEHIPGARIYDPLADHQQSLDYDDAKGRQVFQHHNRMCRRVDLVVAFVPEASMGTAIEMWEAHEHGRGAVVTISPLHHNWAVRFCSDLVFPSFTMFEQALAEGQVLAKVREIVHQRAATDTIPS